MAEIRTLIEPLHLYRYRSLDGEKFGHEISAIQEHYLWCSNFKAMNDPMEGTYEATTMLRKRQDFEDIKRRIFGEKEALGICSFSETNDHELMWAHYADQFRGICVEYNLPSLLSTLDGNVDFVRLFYNEQVHRISTKTAVDEQIAKKILSNKNYRWLYEREWRLLAPRTGRLALGTYGCISCVYLGHQIDLVKKERLLEVLAALGIPSQAMLLDGYRIKFAKPVNKKSVKKPPQ
jgi:hypothetical protein